MTQRLSNVRTLFLSDLHLGYRGVDGASVLDLLKNCTPETIFLAGDIIDGWKLAKRWHWSAVYTEIIDTLIDHAKRGARIIYLPGNHDEAVRRTCPIMRAKFARQTGIRIRNAFIHRTANNKRLVVVHGDQFDHILLRGPISRLSDRFSEFLHDVFGFILPAPKMLIGGHKRRFSLAKALMRRSGHITMSMINSLEGAALRLIKRRKVDGLICGHSHTPRVRTLKGKYIYGNCGMWMGYINTAIIETQDGALKLIRWPDMRQKYASMSAAQACTQARHPETLLIIRRIRQLWSGKGKASLIAARVRTQATQGQEAVINHENGHSLDIGGHATFSDELATKARAQQSL